MHREMSAASAGLTVLNGARARAGCRGGRRALSADMPQPPVMGRKNCSRQICHEPPRVRAFQEASDRQGPTPPEHLCRQMQSCQSKSRGCRAPGGTHRARVQTRGSKAPGGVISARQPRTWGINWQKFPRRRRRSAGSGFGPHPGENDGLPARRSSRRSAPGRCRRLKNCARRIWVSTPRIRARPDPAWRRTARRSESRPPARS